MFEQKRHDAEEARAEKLAQQQAQTAVESSEVDDASFDSDESVEEQVEPDQG